jgi:hypothetical protein
MARPSRAPERLKGPQLARMRLRQGPRAATCRVEELGVPRAPVACVRPRWGPRAATCPVEELGVPYDWSMTEAMEEAGDELSAEEDSVVQGSGDEVVTSAVEVAEAWLAELTDQISVSASDVQDHLLDLWGALDEGPARAEVERWLTETLRRQLYSVSDINERLETLLPVS